MELYWAHGSVASWQVALALLFKDLEVEDRLLDLSAREHLQHAYTTLDPRGRPPTLVDGDVVVSEPFAILAYADSAFPEQPLLGETAEETARIWQKLAEIEHHVVPRVLPVLQALQLGRTKSKRAELREQVGELFAELDRLESHCERGPLNAVDAFLVPVLAMLKRGSLRAGAEEIGLLPVDWSRWTRLFERYEQVRARDGFQRTWPTHW